MLQQGFILIPERDVLPGEALPHYRIDGVAGKPGGFGITYRATTLPTPSAPDGVPSIFWLNSNRQVAIKEFFPKQFADRDYGSPVVRPKNEDDSDSSNSYFDLFLDRFRKEAERLFLLTCLYVLRWNNYSVTGETFSSTSLQTRINDFLTMLASQKMSGFDPAVVGQAVDLIDDFDEPMRASAIAALATRNLPTVYDYFEANGTAYYVMEYLDGGTLQERQAKLGRGHWPWPRLQPFIDALLTGLEEMHLSIPGHPLIHCDVKPGNVMFRSADSDTPVLIDVGLARSTGRDETVSYVPGMTERYAGPELLAHVASLGQHTTVADPTSEPSKRTRTDKASAVGPWTDIYAMAIVFAEMADASRQLKVPRSPERQVMKSQRQDDLAGLALSDGFPTSFVPAIRAALDLNFRARPQSVQAWRAMFRAGRSEGQVGLPPPAGAPFARWLTPQFLAIGGAAALGLAALAWFVLSQPLTTSSGNTPEPPTTSQPATAGQGTDQSAADSAKLADDAAPETAAPAQANAASTAVPSVATANPAGRDVARAAQGPTASSSEASGAVGNPAPTAIRTTPLPSKPPPTTRLPTPTPTPAATPARSGALPRGMRIITDAQRLASLRQSSNGPAVDAVDVGLRSTEFDWLGSDTSVAVRSCGGGSAAQALRSSTGCIINQSGQQRRAR